MAAKSLERRTYKLLLGMLKVIPMLLAFLAILNTMFGFLGIDCSIISMLGGISFLPLVFLYLASFVFRFCIYHRMFLHYILLNNTLELVDYYIGIPIATFNLFIIHISLVGIFLFLVLYFYRRERCCR